ncbi:MAG: Arc family DNA-binding protein [Bernardetiaceae bacterium]|jgi:hypothetical protein|nr:Arc family DNA-binding protein [Bernardetiaceae bacterium]
MSGKKKTFVLRLSPAMMEAVEKWAADEFRSANGQLEWLIAEALKKAGRWKPPASNEPEAEDAPDPEA